MKIKFFVTSFFLWMFLVVAAGVLTAPILPVYAETCNTQSNCSSHCHNAFQEHYCYWFSGFCDQSVTNCLTGQLCNSNTGLCENTANCGYAGQDCCDGHECNGNLECDYSDTCVQNCGREGESCCFGDSCDGSLDCENHECVDNSQPHVR